MKNISFLLLFLVLCGCSRQPNNVTQDQDDVIESINFSGDIKKPWKELHKLKSSAAKGDISAANELYRYYSFEGADTKKSQYYYDLCVKLEAPSFLYNKALSIWTEEEHPDIRLVYKLLFRALELGYIDRYGMEEEVTRAYQTGEIDNESGIRKYSFSNPDSPYRENTP